MEMSTRIHPLVIKYIVMGPVSTSGCTWLQPLHKSKFLFLLLALVLPTLTPLASATSNLNSIWLTGDDQQPASSVSPKLITIKYGDDATRLQVSSSSLHPTVASLEYHHKSATSSSSKPQEFERRSNVPEEPKLSAPDGSNDLNQTTNAHVQFDEEHGGQPQSNRRQDTDTSSRLSPHNIQTLEERTAKDNLTQHPTPTVFNSSTQHQLNNASVQQPFIYYIADGDKWNQPGGDKSSTNENLTEPQQSSRSSDSSTRPFSAHGNQQHSDADIVSYISDHQQPTDVEQATPHPWVEQEVKFPTISPKPSVHYEQKSNNIKTNPQPPPAAVFAPIQARPINTIPISAVTPLVYTTNLDMPLFTHLDSPLKQVGSKYLFEPRHELRFSSNFVQPFDTNGRRKRIEVANGFRYRAQNSRPAKPRKSFFEILGSRINSWVDSENNKATNSLEEEFWGQSHTPQAWQKPKRRVRSPRPKSKPNTAAIYTAEPSMMQAVYIRSPNHLYYPQSFYSPSSSGSGGGAGEVLVTRPTLAYLAPVRQPHVAYPPRALADKFYGSSSEATNSRGSYLPEVSPHISHQGQYETASHLKDRVRQAPGFVPVVAVSVTRTSPQPRSPVMLNDSGGQSSGGGSQQEHTTISPELLEYLEMKTGAPRVKQHQYRATTEDPLGSQAASSGSINRQTDGFPNKIRSGLVDHPSVGEQTTTVKSAVFGYYPHEAQKPLLQAISFLPQYASSIGTLVGPRSTANGELGSRYPHGHRLHESQVNTDQMNLMGVAEESPSLMLQLQASNFAQNDIAYPFRLPMDASNSPYASSTGTRMFSSDTSNYRPIEVYPMNRQQFPAYQIIQPAATLMNPLLASTSTVSNTNTRPSGQLLAVAGSDMSPLFGHNGQLMLSSRPSLRPFMATNQGTDEQLSTRQPTVSSPFLTVNGPTGPDDNESEQSIQDEPSTQAAGGGRNQVNKQGKKRSSEFFASAGQLLLSALPLLLAPTLGLMFASAPLPVARYQAPVSSTAFGSGSLHSSQAGIPGNYINSFSTPGHVHNASPAQLFTPAPQSYSTSSPTATPTTTTSPTTNTTSTSSAGPHRGSAKLLPSVVGTVHRSVVVAGNQQQPPTPSPASLLMLASRNHSGASVTPAPQRLLVTLTTTNPALYTASVPARNDSGGTPYLTPNEPHQHHFHQHVGNTILMLASPDEQANHNTTALHYEGYDGVDFDAQFADLDGASGHLPQAIGNITDDAYLLLEPNSHNRTTTHSPKLYPVSTWPPLRRRTVSLVTSNGNRTYAAEIPQQSDSHQHLHPQFELYQPMNQGLGSYTAKHVARFRRHVQQPEVDPYGRRLKRLLSTNSSRSHFNIVKTSMKSKSPAREVLSSEDSRNKAAHIFTTIMAQVPDENELDSHSSRLLNGGAGRNFEGSTGWNEEHFVNPTNYDQEQEEQQQQSVDPLAMRNLMETAGKKLESREKIPSARLSMSSPQHKQQSLESSQEAEMELNGSVATTKLGRARGHFPPVPLESPSISISPSSSLRFQARATNGRPSQNNAARFKTNNYQRSPLAERIFITDDTKQALMNFNSLLIKDTLAGASQDPLFSSSKARPEQRDESPKRQKYNQHDSVSPPESIHLWRVVSKRPRRQDRDAQETFKVASGELGDDEPQSMSIPPLRLRHNASHGGMVNQANLIENDDAHYMDVGSAAYDERVPGSQLNGDHYEARLHSEPSDYYAPQSQNNRHESDITPSWPHNLTSSTQPVDSTRLKLSKRRYLNTAQQHPHPTSILYDLMMGNRSQPINSSSVYSTGDSRPPVRAQTPPPPPPPPLPQYNQRPFPGHYVPNNYAAEQAFQHHDHKAHYQPNTDNYSDGRQQFDPYGNADQHWSRNQNVHTAYAANPQPSTDYPSEHPAWLPQHSQSSQLDRSSARETRASVSDHLKRPQFSDADRDKLMASYLTCDGLLNDSDHCLERLSCEFSDPRNIEQANKLDRAVSSILLGHILTNTYIPNQFKQRLKSASLFGYMRQGSCSRFYCHKLISRQQQQQQQPPPLSS